MFYEKVSLMSVVLAVFRGLEAVKLLFSCFATSDIVPRDACGI